MASKKPYNEEQELHDIAFDIGKEHQWMNADNQWKDDTCKDRAYKLAKLENEKYKNGGVLPKEKELEISFIITGTYDFFKKNKKQ